MSNNYSCLDNNLSKSLVTTEYWSVSPELRPLGIVTGTVMLLFFLLGLPCNTVIIVSITLQKLYKQPTYILLLCLAVSDLSMCLFVMPLILTSGIAGGFVLGESDYARCKVCQTGVAHVASIIFSLNILALISLDRFLFIKYPLRYAKIVTPKKVMVCIVSVWVLTGFISILPLFGIGDISFDHKTFSCAPRLESETEIAKNIYYAVIVVIIAMLPLTALIITNSWVLWIVQSQIRDIYKFKNRIGDLDHQEAYYESLRTKMNQEKYRKQLRLMRVFGAIFISHIITWIPLIVRVVEAYVKDSDEFSSWSNFIIIISITAHPVLHPVIEACLLPEIRKHFNVCSKLKTCETSQHNNCTSCCNNSYCLDIINATILPKNEINQ